MYSRAFDLSASATAGVAFACNWNWNRPEEGLLGSFFRGAQSFTVVSAFDKVMRLLWRENAVHEVYSIEIALASAIVDEVIYSGLLLTNSSIWSVQRLGVSLALGTKAAETFTGPPARDKLALDIKIGFLWAICREVLVHTLPTSIAVQSLSLLDSALYAFAELGPKENCPRVPLFTNSWYYKALTSFFSRCVANETARTHGLVASITQSLFFSCLDAER